MNALNKLNSEIRDWVILDIIDEDIEDFIDWQYYINKKADVFNSDQARDYFNVASRIDDNYDNKWHANHMANDKETANLIESKQEKVNEFMNKYVVKTILAMENEDLY